MYPLRYLEPPEAVDRLAGLADSHQRRVRFAMLLARRLGRVPTADETEKEYVRSGAFKEDSRSDVNRRKYEQICRWLEGAFEPDKVEFHYRGYPAHRQAMEGLIRAKVTGRRFEWRKGKPRLVSIEKLAALSWAIRHSQGNKQMTHFSYRQALVALRQALGATAHRNELAAMFRVLGRLGLTQRVGGYQPGQHGQGWRVNRLGD